MSLYAHLLNRQVVVAVSTSLGCNSGGSVVAELELIGTYAYNILLTHGGSARELCCHGNYKFYMLHCIHDFLIFIMMELKFAKKSKVCKKNIRI